MRVADRAGAPLEGFTVSLPALRGATTDDPSVPTTSSAPDAVTDAAGEVHVLEFDGSAPTGFNRSGSLTPPDGSGFLPSTFRVPAISGDTTVVVHAAEPSTHVTGVLRDADGDPVAGARLTLGPAGDVTDAAGAYSLGVEPGSYTLTGVMDEGGSALGLPDEWSFSGPLSVSGDRTLDLTLPSVSTLTVRVVDGANGDAPLEGATVEPAEPRRHRRLRRRRRARLQRAGLRARRLDRRGRRGARARSSTGRTGFGRSATVTRRRAAAMSRSTRCCPPSTATRRSSCVRPTRSTG